MRQVSIIGIGQTPAGKLADKSLRDLAVASLRYALQDAGIQRVQALYASTMLSGELTGQENVGALIADAAGLTGIEAVRVEAACGGGGAALHLGVLAVASGMHDLVAVTGVEKMTGHPLAGVLAGLAMAADAEDEAALGLTFSGINALIMRRYMYEYSWHHDDFAAFAINAHRNAATNPNAMFRQPVTLEQYRAARIIADPVNLFDSSPISDGAASVILCPSDAAGRYGGLAVRITGSTLATDTVALHGRSDVLRLEGAHTSARAAYRQASRTAKEIDLFELHDAFSIMSALSLEAAGFAERGDGVRLALDGSIALQGRIPICTMGGLKARGHPVGASGVYQAVECVLQLRAEAGANEVDGARVAMAQSIGGSGASVATHIFEV